MELVQGRQQRERRRAVPRLPTRGFGGSRLRRRARALGRGRCAGVLRRLGASAVLPRRLGGSRRGLVQDDGDDVVVRASRVVSTARRASQVVRGRPRRRRFAPRPRALLLRVTRRALFRFALRLLPRLLRVLRRARRLRRALVREELRVGRRVGGVRGEVHPEQVQGFRPDAVDGVGVFQAAHARREFAQRADDLEQRLRPLRLHAIALDGGLHHVVEEQRVLEILRVLAPKGVRPVTLRASLLDASLRLARALLSTRHRALRAEGVSRVALTLGRTPRRETGRLDRTSARVDPRTARDARARATGASNRGVPTLGFGPSEAASDEKMSFITVSHKRSKFSGTVSGC